MEEENNKLYQKFEKRIAEAFPRATLKSISKKTRQGEEWGIEVTETKNGIEFSIWYAVRDWSPEGLKALEKRYKSVVRETRKSLSKF